MLAKAVVAHNLVRPRLLPSRPRATFTCRLSLPTRFLPHRLQEESSSSSPRKPSPISLLQGQRVVNNGLTGTTVQVGETGTYSVNLQGFFQERGPEATASYGAASIFMTTNGTTIENIARDSVAIAVSPVVVTPTGQVRPIAEASSTFIIRLTADTIVCFWAARLSGQGSQQIVASSFSTLYAPSPVNYQQPWYRISLIKID